MFIPDIFGFFTISISIQSKTREESLEAERRRHPRQSVRDDGIEIFSPETQIIGKLRNISQNGLAFHYTPMSGQKAKPDTIDIMASGPARFYLSGIICRKVYDISALDENQTFTGAESRLCGIEFVSAEKEQKLSFFLKNYLNLQIEEPLKESGI